MKLYDTRFFFEHYYSSDKSILRKTSQELRKTRGKYISVIVIHEIYNLTLEKEGREAAELRATLLEKTLKLSTLTPQ